jgi:methyl-accepting chemotaxis protein
MAKPYKRKRLIVDNLQYRLLIAGVIYFAVVVFIFACGIFVPVILQLEKDGVASYEAQVAAHQFLVLHERIWPPMILAFALLIVHSVLTSHKIAGPLYRIRGVLKSVGGGDLTQKIKLRKKDYLKKDADNVNAAIDSLREKIERLQNHSDEANTHLTELKRSLQSDSAESVRRQTDRLTADIDGLVQCLGEFQTRRDTSGHSANDGDSERPIATPETVESST